MEPKAQYTTDDTALAGSGPCFSDDIDREHLYPPSKWDVRPVTTWPLEMERQLADLRDRVRHLERILHAIINTENPL